MNQTSPSPANTKRARTNVDVEVVRIGKDVIELLTSGMYVSPLTVFREYVQNAADGIDAAARPRGVFQGRVSVTLDHAQRTVSIRDNGAGIRSRDAAAVLLAIGGSPKRGTKARGFRGVGRLSGLASCRELEFICKAAGEDVATHVSWDCRELRRRLADGACNDDLRSIVTSSVSVWEEDAEDEGDHFFQVVMRDVARHRADLLLNERMIAQYLGQVAPVAFDPAFSFGALIEERLAGSGLTRSPIALSINGVDVRRPFLDLTPMPGSPHAIRIESVEFREFADVDGDVGAIAWIAHHEYVRGIPAGLGIRGLRARCGDVQVGEANLFEGLYKEPRFNGWTIGEVHVLDRRIVPNGRRDDFEVNHHGYNLSAQLATTADEIAARCRTASIGRNAEQSIRLAVEEARIAVDGGGDVEVHREALRRMHGKLRVVPNEGLRENLKDDLRSTEAALANAPPRPPALTLDAVRDAVSRIVKNSNQARALIQELERLSVAGDD